MRRFMYRFVSSSVASLVNAIWYSAALASRSPPRLVSLQRRTEIRLGGVQRLLAHGGARREGWSRLLFYLAVAEAGQERASPSLVDGQRGSSRCMQSVSCAAVMWVPFLRRAVSIRLHDVCRHV